MPRARSTTGKVLQLLKVIQIKPVYLLIPVSLSLIAATFEGVGMGLLVPLLQGFLNKNFTFLHDTPVLGNLFALLPESLTSNDRYLFAVLLCSFVALVISKNIFRYLATISVGYFAERAHHHLRKNLFKKYLSFGKLFFDTTNVGHHNTLLIEFTRLAVSPMLTIDGFINALFSLIMYLVVMCFLSWKLTFFALPLFLILHFAIKKLIWSIKTLSRGILEKGNALGKKSVEILSTIALVKSYRTETEEQNTYAQISNEKSRMDFRVRALNALILPTQEIITLIVAVSIFGIYLYLVGRDAVGAEPAFIVYFYIVLNASSKFGTLTGFRSTLAVAAPSLDAILDIFDDGGKYFVHGGSKTFPGLQNEIRAKDLTFTYTNERDVLKNVNLTIQKGKMTAIVGATGSGKTTLISLLMRYYDCPSNSILIDGTDVREFTLDSYLNHIALVSQDTLLLHDSLRNNIAYGLTDVSDKDLTNAVERARLGEFVAKLPQGLDTLIGDRGVKLSGGEKQRVSIARALLKGSDILILDEATSSLDSHTEKLIQEAIDEAIKDRTAIVIAHRLSTIQHADKIIVLEHGEVVEQGPLQALVEKGGKFTQLWEEQKF